MTEYEAKERNLYAINDWCKTLMKDSNKVLRCEAFISRNNHKYHISISKDGIFVKGDGRFSSSLMVRPEGCRENNLKNNVIGKELVYQWKSIKESILKSFAEMKRNEDIMMNFEV